MKMRSTHNLRKIETIIADGVEDEILQLVDSGQQILAESSHGGGLGGEKKVRKLYRLWIRQGR